MLYPGRRPEVSLSFCLTELHDRQVGFEEPLTEETFRDGEVLMREGRPGEGPTLQTMPPGQKHTLLACTPGGTWSFRS